MPENVTASAKLLSSFREEFDLDEAHIRALELAGEHLDTADRLDAAVAEHGVMVPGSAGQLVVNPAVSEARQQRAAAWAILRGLVPTEGSADAASMGQAESGHAVRSPASQRAAHAARTRWERARAAREAS
ncbi:hypothetical protein GCM10009642_19350 [Nocardiopsis metallicus]